jgi:hypothetical protein
VTVVCPFVFFLLAIVLSVLRLWLLNTCFSARHEALRSKSKDWLARNQNNVSEWIDMSSHGLLFRGSNPRSTTLETSTISITPPKQSYDYIKRVIEWIIILAVLNSFLIIFTTNYFPKEIGIIYSLINNN